MIKLFNIFYSVFIWHLKLKDEFLCELHCDGYKRLDFFKRNPDKYEIKYLNDGYYSIKDIL